MSKKERKKGKNRLINGHFIVTWLTIFIALLVVCDLIVFVLEQLINIDDESAYATTLYVVMGLAVVMTVLFALVNKHNFRLSGTLISGINRVADGDYSVELKIPKDATFKDVYINFNKMVKEIAGAQALKDEFVQDFSHELKTPIASINGFANLLIEGDVTDEERAMYLKIIADESARLSHLAESTVMINRLEHQQLAGEVKEFRLDLQIKECVIMLEKEWAAKNINIVSELEEAAFRSNEQLMRQVWLNLLTNAIKFTPNGGEICVTLIKNDGKICVSVADNGIGMSEEVASHIFEKYYQGDKSHATQGSGLGLAIVKRIVALCGGEITVTSREGEGSIFTVFLGD